ncbi:hypothetical protein D3C84_820840 [compost metagenome]
MVTGKKGQRQHVRKVGIGGFSLHQSVQGRQTPFFLEHLRPAQERVQRRFNREIAGTKLDVLHSPIVDAAEPLSRVLLIFRRIRRGSRTSEFVVATLPGQLVFHINQNGQQFLFALFVAVAAGAVKR